MSATGSEVVTNVFDLSTQLDTPAGPVYDWHARPGAFLRLAPPWQKIELAGGHPVIENGSRVELRMRKGPIRVRWTAEHQGVRPGRGFQDVQVKGPFKRWIHTHDFAPSPDGGSVLRDHIEYRLPGGALGQILGGASIRRDLERTFAYRHAVTAADLALHRRYAAAPRLRVAITGASGLVGRSLTALLSAGGHRVLPMVRGRPDDALGWDPSTGLSRPESFPAVDAIVHLAGENIAAGRWTAARLERIRASRVDGTRALVESLGRLERPPATLVSASAVGIYGDRGDEELDEESAPGTGFLAELGQAWEAAARRAERLGIRVANVRLGVVLTPAGGFLGRVVPPFRLGLGGVVGDGRQRVSWVSIDDAIGAVLHVLMEPGLAGPVNVTAPAPVTNRELTHALGRALGRPTLVPLPAFAARAAFGRMADDLLLASAAAHPRRLLASGYEFRHSGVAGALAHVLGTIRRPG